MSETNTQATTADPQPNAPSVDPPAPAQPERIPETAPVSETDAAPEQTEEQKQTRARDEEGRRVAALRARLGAAERAQEMQRAELEFYRQQAARLPPQPVTPEQDMQRLRAEVRAEVEQDLIVRRFHDEGRAQFPDWDMKTNHLIRLGADPGLARLLVETPGGVQLVAALVDDPAEVERIASIPNERGRAVALGKYAARLEAVNGTPRPAAPPVTKAPAPIRPVSGRANPVFNEYNASAQELADFYFKQNLERQQKR